LNRCTLPFSYFEFPSY